MSIGFLDARQKMLEAFLDAAVAADSTISIQSLRVFLGLDKDAGTDWTDCSAASQLPDSSISASSVCPRILPQDINPEVVVVESINWTDCQCSAAVQLLESATPALLQCRFCNQCFEQELARDIHMKFSHHTDIEETDWEIEPP